MKTRINNTKQSIIDAALHLFHANGYDGTSIRDIAHKANINPANIAYYFKNKNGLLEHCFIDYLERYTDILEKEVKTLEYTGAHSCLISIVSKLLQFQGQHYLSARFIMREISLETTLSREVLSTYMAKERYYLHYIIQQGIDEKSFKKVCIPTFILQLKGMLTAPVLHAHYAIELLHVLPHEAYYVEQYQKQLISFLNAFLIQKQDAVII